MLISDKKCLKRTKLHVVKCKVCGVTFGTYRSTKVHCSLTCSRVTISNNLKKGENRKCVACGDTFYSRRSEDRRNCVRKFCSKKCLYKDKKMGLPTGEYLGYDGYIVVSTTDDGRKQIKKHRLIMEESIGRMLSPKEVVHHKDENKLNNAINNLQIMSVREHNQHHAALKTASH